MRIGPDDGHVREKKGAGRCEFARPVLRSTVCSSSLALARAAGGARGVAWSPWPASPWSRRGVAARWLRARLHHEAALERLLDAVFDVGHGHAHDLGHFRDDERLGAIEHALFAEREALGLRQERQALEHVGHVVDRAGAHLVGVVLEAALPVLVIVDLAVAEQMEQPFDLFVGNRAPQADVVDVDHGHEHRRLVRDDAEMEKSAGRAEDRLLLDLLYNAETVVRVNDLVANLK